MATYTENYNLIKPDEEDYYDVTDFNENMDTLDGAMAAAENAAAEISAKIGTPAESGQTLFSLLSQKSSTGMTGIKSIQRVVYTLNKNKSTDSVAIQPVTAANCIALYELLYCTYNSTPQVLYTIKDSVVEFEFAQNNSQTTTVGLWIIEFC
jgi:hypothetical protein